MCCEELPQSAIALVFGLSLVNQKDKMCAKENVAKTKVLETAPICEMKFSLVLSMNYFKTGLRRLSDSSSATVISSGLT